MLQGGIKTCSIAVSQLFYTFIAAPERAHISYHFLSHPDLPLISARTISYYFLSLSYHSSYYFLLLLISALIISYLFLIPAPITSDHFLSQPLLFLIYVLSRLLLFLISLLISALMYFLSISYIGAYYFLSHLRVHMGSYRPTWAT